mmetsp:Transcript_36102/g.70150  ORF Transcript_36102/g.70150 Transcript_36102/m.70150 type:complete len:268 (-) Transcript_36102:1021-1824(-)
MKDRREYALTVLRGRGLLRVGVDNLHHVAQSKGEVLELILHMRTLDVAVHEVQNPRLVIEAHAEQSRVNGAHNKALDLVFAETGGDQGLELVHLEGLEDGRELLEQSQERELLDRHDVALKIHCIGVGFLKLVLIISDLRESHHLNIVFLLGFGFRFALVNGFLVHGGFLVAARRLESGEKLLELRSELERGEALFQKIVHLLNEWLGVLDHLALDETSKHSLPRWKLILETEHRGQPVVAFILWIEDIRSGSSLLRGNGENGQDHS